VLMCRISYGYMPTEEEKMNVPCAHVPNQLRLHADRRSTCYRCRVDYDEHIFADLMCRIS